MRETIPPHYIAVEGCAACCLGSRLIYEDGVCRQSQAINHCFAGEVSAFSTLYQETFFKTSLPQFSSEVYIMFSSLDRHVMEVLTNRFYASKECVGQKDPVTSL